jgi:hypothetical protein
MVYEAALARLDLGELSSIDSWWIEHEQALIRSQKRYGILREEQESQKTSV